VVYTKYQCGSKGKNRLQEQRVRRSMCEAGQTNSWWVRNV